ncbi:hypothetical protein ACFLXK_05170, partial [Chloroflexota bacterium]
EPEPKPAPKAKRAPKPKPEPVLQPEPQPEPQPELAPEPAPQPEPVPQPVEMELTVEGLLSAYEKEGEAADAKFANKILKIMGVVNRIEVKEMLDICYIDLASAERSPLQNVRCVFDKRYGPELNQLTTGQTVTVQGKYDGSIISTRMIDCVLIH